VFVRGDLATSGPAVVLLHGWTADADLNFHPVHAALGVGRRVLAPDLRGHGRSLYPEAAFTIEDAADDVAALLEHLQVERTVLVGYSLGGAVAQTLADRHPELVAGLVLVATELDAGRTVVRPILTRVEGWALTARRGSRGRWLSHRIISRAARANPLVEPLRAWLASGFERGHTASLREAGRAMGRFDGTAIAARRRGTLPVAVVVTERDLLIRAGRQRRLATAWGASLFSIPADHDAPISHPRELTDAIVAAVTQVENAAAQASWA
jgi:pimeloyl-ACP methyl ester carboxylesterase